MRDDGWDGPAEQREDEGAEEHSPRAFDPKNRHVRCLPVEPRPNTLNTGEQRRSPETNATTPNARSDQGAEPRSLHSICIMIGHSVVRSRFSTTDRSETPISSAPTKIRGSIACGANPSRSVRRKPP